jgi:uncharacterized protein (UPF0548 family)
MKMPSLRKPSAEAIQHFLERQKKLNFTYSAIGATATVPPSGYVVDHTRIKLGFGERLFEEAKVAIRRWQHFQLGWVKASPTDTPIQQGEVIAVLGHVLGFWWLNACRIVYVVDEVNRFGFAYGTLPGHAESGEERFQIEWDQSTNDVWYDILAFSRPNYFVTKVGYPVVRRFQKKFARDSAAAMKRALGEAIQ